MDTFLKHHGWGGGRVATIVDSNSRIRPHSQSACRLCSTLKQSLGGVPVAVTAIRLAAMRSCIRAGIVSSLRQRMRWEMFDGIQKGDPKRG